MGEHCLRVEGNDFDFSVGIIVRKEAAARRKAVVGVRNGELDGLDTNLENVSGLSSLDIDGAGQDVPARAAVFHLIENISEGLLDLISGDTCFGEAFWAGREKRLNLHGIARVNSQYWRGACGVVTPSDGFWSWLELVSGVRSRFWARLSQRGATAHKNQKNNCEDLHRNSTSEGRVIAAEFTTSLCKSQRGSGRAKGRPFQFGTAHKGGTYVSLIWEKPYEANDATALSGFAIRGLRREELFGLALFLQCPPYMRKGQICVGMLLVLVFLSRTQTAKAQEKEADSSEYEAQSQYLRSFVEFVNWPSKAEQGVHPTINFCILGSDPYGKLLDEAILGHSFGGRQGVIVRGRYLADLGACDVLFIGKSEQKTEDKILKKLRDKNVLTIAETEGFAARGGVIQFVWQKDHLGFLINEDAANRAGLKISASLLALAQIVHDQPSKAAP